MSTPEQPDTPPLTRKQMREIRNTGVTPVVTSEDLERAASAADALAQPAETPVIASVPPVAAPLPRAAEPVPVAAPPVADASVELGVSPLTRRQARQQERIRTASVPVITPEVAAAHAAQTAGATAVPSAMQPVVEPPRVVERPAPVAEPARVVERTAPVIESVPAAAQQPEDPFALLGVTSGSAPIILDAAPAAPVEAAPVEVPPQPEAVEDAADDESEAAWPFPASDDEEDADAGPRVVDPAFGAALLSGTVEPPKTIEPSFDDLITRSTSGSIATPNALILSQSLDGGSIVAPVTATGEVLITGTLNLPEGLGSTGHVPGTADGKEVDAVLVDGELPAHSSPTPIAASSAISTVKTPGEIIRPPAPEKGSRLMLTLAITAGVLALALVGVLILAFATGVF